MDKLMSEMTPSEMAEALMSAAGEEEPAALDALLAERSLLTDDMYKMAIQLRMQFMYERHAELAFLMWAEENGHPLDIAFADEGIYFLISGGIGVCENDDDVSETQRNIQALLTRFNETSAMPVIINSLKVWIVNSIRQPRLWPVIEYLSEQGIEIPHSEKDINYQLLILSHISNRYSHCISDFVAYGLALKPAKATLLPVILNMLFHEEVSAATPLEYMNQAPAWQREYVLPFMVK